MAVYQLTLAVGVNEEGEARKDAYRKAAAKLYGNERGAINRWCKKILDEAAGFHAAPKKKN